MRIHREGYLIILISALILGAIQVANYLLYANAERLWLYILLSLGVLVMFILIVQFFRIPSRTFVHEELDIVCPADGKVVVI